MNLRKYIAGALIAYLITMKVCTMPIQWRVFTARNWGYYWHEWKPNLFHHYYVLLMCLCPKPLRYVMRCFWTQVL